MPSDKQPVGDVAESHRRKRRLQCYNRAVTKDEVRAAISQHEKRRISGPDLVKSAVLVPLLYKDNDLTVLLTERTLDVASHKGQVCFPGGSAQNEDESLLATALREAWEEIALRPEDVEVIGELDDGAVRSSGFVITPFVGFIPYPYRFRASESETKDIFFVPISVLMDPTRFHYEERTIDGHYYNGPLCDFEGHIIWGATGRILEHLVALLRGSAEPRARLAR